MPLRLKLFAGTPLFPPSSAWLTLTGTRVLRISRTMKDAVLPLARPLRTTRRETLPSLVVPRGTNVVVGIMASNRQRALWGPDACEWRPERWLAPLPRAVEEAALPGVYSNTCVINEIGALWLELVLLLTCVGWDRMTFLGGGRACM